MNLRDRHSRDLNGSSRFWWNYRSSRVIKIDLFSVQWSCLRWHRSLPAARRNGDTLCVRKGHIERVTHTEGPDGVSAPQIGTFNRTEVAVPQIERCAVLSIARNIWCVTRVPPWVPGERTDRCHRWRFQEIEQRFLTQQGRVPQYVVHEITCAWDEFNLNWSRTALRTDGHRDGYRRGRWVLFINICQLRKRVSVHQPWEPARFACARAKYY